MPTREYANCYDRAAIYFLMTCAPYEIDKGQSKVWDFMMKIYHSFEQKAELLGLKVLPDVSFGRWESQKGRENDVKTIRNSIDKIMEFEEQLFSFLKVCEKREDGLYVQKDSIKLKKLIYLAKHATELAKDEEGKVHHDHELVYFTRVVFDDNKD